MNAVSSSMVLEAVSSINYDPEKFALASIPCKKSHCRLSSTPQCTVSTLHSGGTASGYSKVSLAITPAAVINTCRWVIHQKSSFIGRLTVFCA